MNSHSRRLCALTSVMALLSIFFRIATYESSDATIFDSPFPSTAYKRVLDTAMLVWEDVRLLNSGRSGLDTQACEDLIVGRLVRLNSYCDVLAKEQQKRPLLAEDKEYLVHILKTVNHEYAASNQTIKSMLKIVLNVVVKLDK